MDDRKFATAKMNKPMNQAGEIIPFTLKEVKEIIHKNDKPRNYRKLFYPFLILLLILDWVFTLLSNLVEIITNSIKELALSLETFIINANTKPPESET